jgi:hypothetical protein
VPDPIISAAFAVESSPGAYALLLGSGVSRASGVPTGWEVVLDLIERVAALEGDDTAGEPENWYAQRYGATPDYSVLLEQLASAPADRQQLLRAYFEPTPEELEQGLKVPTAAHHAIARLVASGRIKVVVTTNFDRLLERALDAVGVVPTVIATPDAAEGALPMAHVPCTIIKVHGDYLDARIRNTIGELSEYDERIDKLLDRVFDEYGLVVCGWSADWDAALVAAIERCPTHRFTTYWAARSDPGDRAGDLIALRRATSVQIDSADAFFAELEEKVTALHDLGDVHPESAAIAVAAAKRYLPNDQHRIRLHDLLFNEAARAEQTPTPLGGSQDEYLQLVAEHEHVCDTLAHLMATVSYWATPDQLKLVRGVLDRLAARWGEPVGGSGAFVSLRDYPLTIALYAAGLGALAADDLTKLARLLGEGTAMRRTRRISRLRAAAVNSTLESDWMQPREGQRRFTPVNDHLHNVLREPLRELISQDAVYTGLWDRLEYLITLAWRDIERGGWAPVGSFGWRNADAWGDEETLYAIVEAEARAGGDDWGFLQGPLFAGSLERFLAVQQTVATDISGLHWH